MNVSTLRPGLLVSLKTSLTGNVKYATRDIVSDHLLKDGTRQATWETQRVIEDAKEHEEATTVRSKARSLVAGPCSPSSFGLLCPETQRDMLDAAVAEAREIVAEFNARARLTRIGVYVIVGRVASDDMEAIRAINGEVAELMTAMEKGLKALDVAAVRKAANAARALGQMLSPDAAKRSEAAIRAAREAARRIVAAGETAAVEIDRAALRTIRTARTAFLDLDDAKAMQTPAASGRAIDLDAPMATAAAPPASRVAYDL